MSRTNKDYDKDKDWSEKMFKGVPSWFKRLQKRRRRAKEKDAENKGREYPRFRKTDHWDWW